MVVTYSKFATPEPHQVAHNERCKNIIARSHCFVDTSAMGRGKTYNIFNIAQTYNFSIGLVAPVTVISEWERVAKEHNVPIIFTIGYQSLRSMTGKQPKHGFLQRVDHRTENGAVHTTFEATDTFRNLVKQGFLLVFDEIQNIKNNSDQYKACKALAAACLDEGGKTRFALLSGSPYDKEEHVVNLLRLIGYIRHPNLFTYYKERAELKLFGAQELIDICRHYDKEGTDYVLATCPYDHKTVPHLCYRLYLEVVQPLIVSAIPQKPGRGDNKDVKNGYYGMSDPAGRKYIQAINELGAAARYNPDTMMIDRKNANYGAITTALTHSEESKIEIFERLTRVELDKVWTENGQICKHKVVVFVNFINTITQLSMSLAEYNPLIMKGDTKQSDRGNIISEFQNNPERRLLISITRVGGAGINLDDQVGDMPRFMLISPNYNILDIHQATGRIDRNNTKSKATIRIVYGKVGSKETSILNALARKSDVLRQTLAEQVQNGVKFPGDYMDEIETEIKAN